MTDPSERETTPRRDAARRWDWLDETADAFAAQAAWHEREGHPLAGIIVGPGRETWTE